MNKSESDVILDAADTPGVGFPLPSRSVLPILAELGYEMPKEVIQDLIARGRITGPKRTDSGEVWDRDSLMELVGACEALRYWSSEARRHQVKFTEFWRLYLAARSAGQLAQFNDSFHKVPTRELCILLTESDNRVAREQLLPLLLARLEVEGNG